MKEKIDISFIKRYRQGKYSFKELKVISSWFRDIHFHDQLSLAIKEHWSEIQKEEDLHKKDLSPVLKKLKSQIKYEQKQARFSTRLIHLYSRVAAILLIPILIYTVYDSLNVPVAQTHKETTVEFVSPRAIRTNLELPDGTKVVLNGNSRLKYQSNFSNNRSVVLTGQAYFDVVHNSKSPFVVHTTELDVEVLGTEFSVAAIEKEATVDVILKDGKVNLLGKNNSFSELINPDEKFQYHKVEKRGKVFSVDADALTAWKDGKLIFRDEPLGEVLKRISRWYNVKFDVQDNSVLDFVYRATFDNESLEDVLRLIELTAPIKYEIKHRKQNSNGGYEEKLISIKLKK